jgi:hypothetical protein
VHADDLDYLILDVVGGNAHVVAGSGDDVIATISGSRIRGAITDTCIDQ